MIDTYGPMYETPLARWDRPTSSWRTCAATSLWDLPMSSLTLPTWGCLRGGELYELPTPEPATVEHGYSSLPTPMADNSRGLPNGGNFQSLPNAVLGLPTPKASDGERGRDLPRIRQDESGRELATAVGLLPTPTVQDGRNTAGQSQLGRNTLPLNSLVILLPTPAVNDMGAGKDPQAWDEWAARQKAADGRPAPHGKSLEQEALRVGVNTHQPLTAGSASWADLLQPLPFAEPIGTA
jgi:hypothetical protein